MFHRLLSHGMRIVSYVERKSKLWIPYVMPLLILLGYLEEALYSVWHLHVPRGGRNPNPNLLASICQLLDISIILTGTVLTLIGWHAGSGCSMLLLHRLVQRFYGGMWITDLLEHFVDVGCLLLLLALRLSQRQRLDWCNNNNSSNKQQEQLQRYLLLGRIGLCCEFLLWLGQHASGNHHHPQVRYMLSKMYSDAGFTSAASTANRPSMATVTSDWLHINALRHTLLPDVQPGGTVSVVAPLELGTLFRLA